MPHHVWTRTLKSLAVGLGVFCLGRASAVWLTARNIHGFLAFFDNVVAAIAAGLVVLLYERGGQRTLDRLRESEERFRLVADTAPALIWMSDTDKLCTYFNKPWLDFTGRSMRSELGNGWSEGVHPDDLRRCMDTYTEAFDRREEFRMEYRLRRHDGEYRWVLDAGTPRFDEDRSFVGYVGIAIDVTERKRVEEELRESEERFRLAAHAGKMYAYAWDPTADVVTRSKEYVNIHGLSDPAERLTRHQVAARVHPDDRARFTSSVDQLTPENPTTQFRYRALRPDGAVIWLEKCGLAIFDQQRKLLRVVGMVADITERMRAEERLRESEAQFHDLAEQSRTTHWEVDPQGLFTYVSDVSQASWGYRPDEVVGRMHFYDLNPEEGREAFKATVFAVVEREQPFLDVVHAVETKDGRIMWGSTSGIPLRNADGTLRGYRGSCTDITERKLAHEALAGVSRKLIEAQEQERTRIGSELHDDIGQRLAMLAVELQQLHDNSLILPDVRSRMVEFQQRIVEMATDIQSLSHELHSAKLQYLGLAAAMRSFCQEFGERQKVEIDFKTHDLPSPLPPDITLCFFRVLQEALHNSAKHSGVRHFEVQLWGAPDEIHLTVSDSGAGFDPETVKTSRGLGLISMEERLKLVNGTLSIESQPEKGTTVHVCVPLRSGSDSMRAAV